MRLKNKGYTLVELVLSIAVFAIVMVGVISIMSSTLKSYSEANIDVSVQEDCQMAANQLEEYLCDADSLFAYDGNPANGWGFKDQDGITQTITYDGSTVKLTKGGVPYTIAKNVSSFSIDNWKTSQNVTAATEKAYNQACINMTMSNNGTEYTLRRNIYFRNDVENNTFHGINNLMAEAGGGGGGASPTDITLNIKRYETINLTTDYFIRYDCKLYKKNGASWDVITDPGAGTADNSFFALTAASDSPALTTSYAGASTFYVKTGSSVNQNFNLVGTGDYKIVGYKLPGSSGEVTIYLTYDAVRIMTDGVCVQQHETGTVNGEGFTSPINVKGLNVNEGLKDGGLTMSFRYVPKKGGANLGSNGLTSSKNVAACTNGIISWGNYTSQYDYNPKRVMFGLAPDPFNGGLSVVGPNDTMSGDVGGDLHGQTNITLYFDVDMTSGGVAQTVPDFEVKFTGLSTGF